MRRSNFTLRLQPSLMEEARKEAESEGVVLNELINSGRRRKNRQTGWKGNSPIWQAQETARKGKRPLKSAVCFCVE